MGLPLTPITNILEGFVMLGTHSQLHRGQMSYICDISPLRVNLIKQCNFEGAWYKVSLLLRFIITVNSYEETANLGIDPVIFLLTIILTLL